jgi:hypothetical protein
LGVIDSAVESSPGGIDIALGIVSCLFTDRQTGLTRFAKLFLRIEKEQFRQAKMPAMLS